MTDEEVEETTHILTPIEVDDLRELFFSIAYVQHGGSGLGVTLGELEEMRAADLFWYRDRVMRERQREATALKPKSSTKKAR